MAASADPRADEIRSLIAAGQAAFLRGEMQKARETFDRLVRLDGSHPNQWLNLALACRNLKDDAGEQSAIDGALRTDPMDLAALILRGNLAERQGDRHKAVRAYGAAAAVAPPQERLHPDLRPALAHALEYRAQYDQDLGTYLDDRLAADFAALGPAALGRFRESLDILVGRKRRFDSLPANYYFPHLAPLEFFDPERFDWIGAAEAATDAIRAEFLEILRAEEGFAPYINYPPDVPHNQWAELNNSPRWSAFHLWKEGRRIEPNASRCPATVRFLEGVGQPDMPGRTPSAMFSLLKPRTRIPAHHGATNARLVAHLPLIVPEGCGFRVGNEARAWFEGRPWVFDDTIEHEAWNDSDALRVVLIFDVWHPDLTEPERAMIGAMAGALADFTGGAQGFDP